MRFCSRWEINIKMGLAFDIMIVWTEFSWLGMGLSTGLVL
jgi:hypothetical protein